MILKKENQIAIELVDELVELFKILSLQFLHHHYPAAQYVDVFIKAMLYSMLPIDH